MLFNLPRFLSFLPRARSGCGLLYLGCLSYEMLFGITPFYKKGIGSFPRMIALVHPVHGTVRDLPVHGTITPSLVHIETTTAGDGEGGCNILWILWIGMDK